MKITRATSSSLGRDEWTVDLEDGERPGMAWAPAGTLSDEQALAAVERQQVVLHRAFEARLRSLVGLELKP